MKKSQYVDLSNLGHGAAAEMFQDEMGRLIANITDPNTKAEQVRSITLKLKVKPSKDRTFCAAEISCDSKLAAVMPFETQLFVGMDGGKGVATEYESPQKNLTVTNDEGEEVDIRTGVVVNMRR